MNRPMDITNCSACSENHPGLMTYSLNENETISGLTYTRYAICPSTKVTIYIAYQDATMKTIQKPK